MSDRSHDTWESEPADSADQLNQIMYSNSMCYHRGHRGVPAYSSPQEERLSLRELRNAFGVPSTVSSYDQGVVSRLAGPVPGDERLVGTRRAPPPRLDSYHEASPTQGQDYSVYHETAEASQYAPAQLGRPEYAERTEHDEQLIRSIPLNFTDTRRTRPVAGSGPAWSQSPGTLGDMLPRHEARIFPSQHTPWKVSESSPSAEGNAHQLPVKKKSNTTLGSASEPVTMAVASAQSSTGTLPESVQGQWTYSGGEHRSIPIVQYIPILPMSPKPEPPEPAELEEKSILYGRHLSRRGTARDRRDVGTIPRQVVSDALGPMSKTERALHDLDAWDGCPKDELGSQ